MSQIGSVQHAGGGEMLQSLMEHRTALVAIAARITGCPSRAEDVVQDAYFRLSRLQQGILPLPAQISYVFKVVRHLAIDHYRKQMMELKYVGHEDEGLHVTSEVDMPEVTNVHRETLEALDLALAELPDRTRYAFEMYRIHGVQQKEIATELGVSPTLVNFMVRDALIHCRKSLYRQQV